jgi:hypothetical protein
MGHVKGYGGVRAIDWLSPWGNILERPVSKGNLLFLRWWSAIWGNSLKQAYLVFAADGLSEVQTRDLRSACAQHQGRLHRHSGTGTPFFSEHSCPALPPVPYTNLCLHRGFKLVRLRLNEQTKKQTKKQHKKITVQTKDFRKIFVAIL